MKKIRLSILFLLSSMTFLDAAMATQNEVEKWEEVQEIDGEKVRVIRMRKPFQKTVDVPIGEPEARTCDAEIATDYWQEDTILKVETMVENEQCGASTGRYSVKVRTRDENNETHIKTYQENWSREDNNSVETVHTYSMNGHSELIKVRIRLPINGSCVCADAESN